MSTAGRKGLIHRDRDSERPVGQNHPFNELQIQTEQNRHSYQPGAYTGKGPKGGQTGTILCIGEGGVQRLESMGAGGGEKECIRFGIQICTGIRASVKEGGCPRNSGGCPQDCAPNSGTGQGRGG